MTKDRRQERLKRIYQTVADNPGARPGRIAQLLSLSRSSVTRALPALERQGYLLSEDEHGRLYPYGRA
ncbi:MAG: winged helix-turn-helix transcriptional regulator [Candidatus Promineifilaceae bacterium]